MFLPQIFDQKKKNSGGNSNPPTSNAPTLTCRPKTLGGRRGLHSPFILPIKDARTNEGENRGAEKANAGNSGNNDPEKVLGRHLLVCQLVICLRNAKLTFYATDERLKNIEPRMIELIENEIMDNGAPVNWDDIAGLEFAKNTIKEIVVWPMLRPDIFTGLRGPPRGNLKNLTLAPFSILLIIF